MKRTRLYVAVFTDGDLGVAEFGNEKERLEFLAAQDEMTSDCFNLDVDADGQVTTDLALTGDDAAEQIDQLKA